MKFSGILIIFILPLYGIGQNFQEMMSDCFHNSDTICQRTTLTSWEKVKPNDPELFVGYFNYHFLKSMSEVVTLSTDMPEADALEIKDSTDRAVGFISSGIRYDSKEIKLAFDKINTGIDKFPDRLDMRFGKIYVLGQIKKWDQFTEAVIKTVNYSVTNNNQWMWNNNEKRDDGKELFLTSLQDYQLDLYDQNDDDLLPSMRKIANAILAHYPEHIESLSNLAITHMAVGEFEKGLVSLLKAEKVNPKDHIVLLNIAHCYKSVNKGKKAIEYYKKAIPHSDEETVKFAEKQITILNEK